MRFTEDFGEWIVPALISVLIHALILGLAFGARGCGEKKTTQPPAALTENRGEEVAPTVPQPDVSPSPNLPVKPTSVKPETPVRTTKTSPETPVRTTKPPLETVRVEDPFWEYHTVQKGEFLEKIAARIAGSDDKEAKKKIYRKILELNPGLKPNEIQAGQKIKVPKKAE